MKRDVGLKRRESKELPTEKLYGILRKLYPKSMADEKYTELIGLEPPKSEENDEWLCGL